MSATLLENVSSSVQLKDHIKYPQAGILNQVIIKDKYSQSSLFCLAANTDISEHTSTRNATVQVLEGRGILTLEGKDISLEPGVFIFMPAHAPHAVKSEENLAFLLTLSDVL